VELKGEFDYIIAGAGASGLSLLWRMLNDVAFQNKQVLVIDKSFGWKDEKTWCFWDDAYIPDKTWIDYTWNVIEVATDKGISTSSGKPIYYSIHSRKFRERILNQAQQSANVTLLSCSVIQFETVGNQGVIHTSEGSYAAEWIFQSTLREKSTGIEVLQHFKGFFIKTKQPVFDSNSMTLMDFRLFGINQSETAFFYVLPFSADTALIEYTLFSSSILETVAYDKAIRTYLNKRFQLSEADYTVTDTEFGVIPMSDQKAKNVESKRVISIGTSGGATKPTTGYTFTRIQKHCDLIIDALKEGVKPHAFPVSTFRFRLYDRLLLDILETSPKNGPLIFKTLLEKNRIQNILEFLDEKTTLFPEAKLFLTLPWLPFLTSLSKHIFRLNRI
jgi:lycopene beta-cyclase